MLRSTKNVSNNFPWNICLLRHVPVSYFGRHTGGESFTFLTIREAMVQDVRNLWHQAEEGSVECGGALATWSTLLDTSCLSPSTAGFSKGNEDFCVRSEVLCWYCFFFLLVIVTNFLFQNRVSAYRTGEKIYWSINWTYWSLIYEHGCTFLSLQINSTSWSLVCYFGCHL